LIQQTQYTPTTPKYNFPHTPEDLALPQQFIELSLLSMKTTHGQSLQPNLSYTDITATSQPTTPTLPTLEKPSIQPIPLKPLQNEITPVVAIDVSSIKIGETQTGILIAIRGAIVWKQKNQYKYLRLGPFPFHMTEENKKEIYNLFRRYYFEAPTSDVNAPILAHMQTRMSSLLEHWLQMDVSCSSHNSLILWDGCLTAGTPDSPVQVVSQLLEAARNRYNTVLAFSKTTSLRFGDRRLTDLTWEYQPPYLLEINGFSTSLGPLHLLGRMYVAKLTNGACSFRLDIDREVPREQEVEAVQKLLGNDLLLEGYPETLRLAHIFSTFTANEVIGIQRFTAQTYGLKIVERPNVRRLLFGPYGKGPEE